MGKVSIIIPARNEIFLPQTVNGILNSASGDIEILVILDGYWPASLPVEDKRVNYIHWGQARGMRAGINAAATMAKGEWLLKCDAHVLFAEGFDEVLQDGCMDNWIVIPRRYSLDAENWCRRDKAPVDYMYYFYPYLHPDDLGLHGRQWDQRRRERELVDIDEDMSFQGSCWFMHKKHWGRIGGMSEEGYETFMGEPQEIGLKTQLGPWDGSVMRNKRTWYAHLHKGKTYGRMYFMSSSERDRGNAYSFDFWWRNRWTKREHDIEWLIDRFWPLPHWPKDWKELKQSGKHG